MIEEQRIIDDYLTLLCQYLSPLIAPEREEIVGEIRAHIRDSTEQRGVNVAEVLAHLGTPDQLAAQYRDGLLMSQASHSYSPSQLLRGVLRFTRRGILGISVAMVGVFGYWLGAGVMLIGLLMPLWSMTQHHHPATAVAPSMFLMLITGCIILLFTTLLMRAALRVFRRWQSPLGGSLVTRALR
jgi:uncharacterized membrane protein